MRTHGVGLGSRGVFLRDWRVEAWHALGKRVLKHPIVHGTPKEDKVPGAVLFPSGETMQGILRNSRVTSRHSEVITGSGVPTTSSDWTGSGKEEYSV